MHGHDHFGVDQMLEFKRIVDCFVFVVALRLVECGHCKICKMIMVTVAGWPLLLLFLWHHCQVVSSTISTI